MTRSLQKENAVERPHIQDLFTSLGIIVLEDGSYGGFLRLVEESDGYSFVDSNGKTLHEDDLILTTSGDLVYIGSLDINSPSVWGIVLHCMYEEDYVDDEPVAHAGSIEDFVKPVTEYLQQSSISGG